MGEGAKDCLYSALEIYMSLALMRKMPMSVTPKIVTPEKEL